MYVCVCIYIYIYIYIYQDQARPDVYITLGNDYKVIRDMITKIVLGEDISSLTELIKVCIRYIYNKTMNRLVIIYMCYFKIVLLKL